MKPLFRTGLLFLVSMALISQLLMAFARIGAQKSVDQALAKQLPQAMELALANANTRQEIFNTSAKQILLNFDGFRFDNATRLPVIEEAGIEQLVFHDAVSPPSITRGWGGQLDWLYGNRRIQASYQLGFVYNPAYILIQSAIMAALAIAMMTLLPGARRYYRNDWISKLKTYQFDQREAENIAEITEDTPFYSQLLQRLRQETSLDINQICQLIESGKVRSLEGEPLSWFIIAIKQGLPLESSLAVAARGDELSFDLDDQKLIIHGLTVPFPKTPLFYFYWYASRKVSNSGPYLNPAQGKPDPVAGAELATLMEAHNGHLKAIHDLEDAGMKGKTLDQNRNKIKDELTRLLGIDLAAPYLFSSERDPRSMRYSYELSLPTSFIHLPPE